MTAAQASLASRGHYRFRQVAAMEWIKLRPASAGPGRPAQPQVGFWIYAEHGLANRDGWEINL